MDISALLAGTAPVTPPTGTPPAATDGFAATLGQLLAGAPGIATGPGGAVQAGLVSNGAGQKQGQIAGGAAADGQGVTGLAGEGIAGAALPPRLVAQLPGASRTPYLPADMIEGVPADPLAATPIAAPAMPDAMTKLPRPLAANLPAAVAPVPGADAGEAAPLPIVFDDTQSDPIEFPDQLPLPALAGSASTKLPGEMTGELTGEPSGELAAADETDPLPAADGQPVLLAALPPEPAQPPVRRGAPDLDPPAAEAAKAPTQTGGPAVEAPATGFAEAPAPSGAATEIATATDTRQPAGSAATASSAAPPPTSSVSQQTPSQQIASQQPPPQQPVPAIAAATAQPAAASGSTRSEAPGARLALNSDFAARMGVQIARRLAQGSDELTVRMDPAELGRIQVRLAFDDQGALRAVVAADSASVIEAMRRDLADITRALTDAGVRADGQSFRFDRGGQDGSQGQSAWARWQNARGTNALSGDELGAQELSYRPARRNGRLDLIA